MTLWARAVPQIRTPAPSASDHVDTLIYSGEVLSNDQAQPHSFTSDVESSSADTSGGNSSGSENGDRSKFEEDPLIQSICVRTTNLSTVLGPGVYTRVLGRGRCASTSTLTSRRSLASVPFVL
ncbi:hypothetical protein CEP53_001593 [Fusarium sp. AF-6]|nr:hypothetical protein CEP53_001593 [Fusarium sp. AF-6]